MDTTPQLRPLHRRTVAVHRGVRWLAGAFAAAATIGVAQVTDMPVSDVVMFGSTIVAAAGFLRGAQRPSPMRRTLMLLGWSATAWVAGVGSWLGAERVLGHGPGPNPLSSVLMVIGTVLALAGLLAAPAAPVGLGQRLRLALEGLLAAACVLFIVWEPAIDPLLRADGRETPTELVALAVPGADLVLLGVIGAVIWRSTRGRFQLGLLGASAGMRAVTDTLFVYFALAGFSARGDAAVDLGWAFSYAALAVTALAAASGPATGTHARVRAPGRRSQIVTHLPVIAALATAIVVGIAERHLRGASSRSCSSSRP